MHKLRCYVKDAQILLERSESFIILKILHFCLWLATKGNEVASESTSLVIVRGGLSHMSKQSCNQIAVAALDECRTKDYHFAHLLVASSDSSESSVSDSVSWLKL